MEEKGRKETFFSIVNLPRELSLTIDVHFITRRIFGMIRIVYIAVVLTVQLSSTLTFEILLYQFRRKYIRHVFQFLLIPKRTEERRYIEKTSVRSSRCVLCTFVYDDFLPVILIYRYFNRHMVNVRSKILSKEPYLLLSISFF